MSLNFIKGDLLNERNVDAIGHIVDCLTVRSHGRSHEVGTKFIIIYNSNSIRSAENHVKLTGADHQIKRDVIWNFGSSYCYNDKFIIYPSYVIEKL